MNKEVPLKERIEKLYESGYVNEFNYLENQLQEARYLVTILHKQTEEKDKEIERLNNKYNYALKLLADFNMPCECCDCKISDEYCEENCSVDDECYKKCWNKYIELELKEGKE